MEVSIYLLLKCNIDSSLLEFLRRRESESIKKLTGDKFINVMNCFWIKHPVRSRTRKTMIYDQLHVHCQKTIQGELSASEDLCKTNE